MEQKGAGSPQTRRPTAGWHSGMVTPTLLTWAGPGRDSPGSARDEGLALAWKLYLLVFTFPCQSTPRIAGCPMACTQQQPRTWQASGQAGRSRQWLPAQSRSTAGSPLGSTTEAPEEELQSRRDLWVSFSSFPFMFVINSLSYN